MLITGCFLLMTFGVYFIMQQSNIQILGYVLVGQSINLFVLSVNQHNNLLGQSLILTSIVISLGMVALLLKK